MQRCPHQCITMKEDEEGFLYPFVDENSCIDCGLCEKVCHELHPYERRKPLNLYAAMNNDDEVREHSSSGGIFHMLAEKTLGKGGVVFGARFDEEWQVVIASAKTIEEVMPFLGSKYVQARTEDAFRKAEDFLKQGRHVLFSGTPCQIAGLHHFLRKEYDNLITVDFVCHGVPSPLVWRRYLTEVTESVHRINEIHFRNKKDGWKRFCLDLKYDRDSQMVEVSSFHGVNHFMRAFLSDMILRPSCHDCMAKEGKSMSDITIADFWGVNIEMPEMDDDKGTSLLIVNTEKGKEYIDWERMKWKETELETVRKYNAGLSASTIPHHRREVFFKKLMSTESITTHIDDMLRPTFISRMRIKLGRIRRELLANLKAKKRTGGDKTKEYLNTSQELPDTLLSADRLYISDISFRNKEKGWKEYRMTIKLKEQE